MAAFRPPGAAMLDALKSRYDRLADRVLCSLSEIEREDVRSFDRWFYRGGGWRWLVGIIALTTSAAYVASRLPWNMRFVEAAVLFNVVVLTLLWSGLAAWFGYRKFSGKLFRYIVVAPLLALAGAFVGASIAGLVTGVDPLSWLQDSTKVRHIATAGLAFGVLYVLVVALIANLRHREYLALAARLESEARQSELSRQLAESKLRMLQLQVEPHFLFNSLGSAQQLAEKGAPEAARLISDLVRFLRAASPTLSGEATTLGQERALVEAYLGIMKTRLAGRLAWSVEIPASLADASVPPGMLITLVENAIKHGIEPLPGGGRVDVRAFLDPDRRIVLSVADTGAGAHGAGATGQGIGLANIRERLALLFGDRAALEVGGNAPRGFVARIGKLFGKKKIDAQTLEELEEVLFTADIGPRAADRIFQSVKSGMSKADLEDADKIWTRIRQTSREILAVDAKPIEMSAHKPFVLLVLGVNGVGKTTTIGKLAKQLTLEGKKVLLAAGDTFRAAATEQLEEWGKRAEVPVVKGKSGGDPSSVIFDAIKKGVDEAYDVVICDTAGRLHSNSGLMDELKKLRRVADKAMPGCPHETWMVLDATTGQNAIAQAKTFKDDMGITGIVLTKLDGSSKGGVVLGICDELKVPVRFVGIGEKIGDLRPFDPGAFVEALYSDASTGESA